MPDPHGLLADLLGEVRRVEDDLRKSLAAGEATAKLRAVYERVARQSETAAPWHQWRDEQLNSAAVNWVLGTVLVRFLEDNQLIAGAPFLAGADEDSLKAAELAQARWLADNPLTTSVDWLLMTFSRLPDSLGGLDVWRDAAGPFAYFRISPSAADDLIAFWRRRTADNVAVHRFRDPQLSTDFIEILYEGLSPSARARYALMPTPQFVVSLLLTHTLDRAIDEFGLAELKIIDPACGSGRFLVAAFEKLANTWVEHFPKMPPRERVIRGLQAVHGVDINPSAAIVARFRLLISALRLSGLSLNDLANEDHCSNIVVGDALIPENDLPLPPPLLSKQQTRLRQVLQPGRYQVVVSEPPYLTVSGASRNAAYRRRYSSCTGSYALTIPFAELMFNLAAPLSPDSGRGAGYVGQFISNSFMKREFGKKLVEDFYARLVTITHVLDTSGAYIPGRGTPTVILIGRNRPPKHDDEILVVAGLRGEPTLPARPEEGAVWRSIVEQSATANLVSEWSLSFQVEHNTLNTHPWSLATPRVAGLLQRMSSAETLKERTVRIGYAATTGSDSVFVASPRAFWRIRAENGHALVPVITGSEVRDWTAKAVDGAYFPRNDRNEPVDVKEHPRHYERLWPYRTTLNARPNYSGRSYLEDGRAWHDWHQVASTEDSHDWSIVFSWVATHNQFALLRQRAIPLSSAPVVKLARNATEADHVGLVALLNSSSACFWMKHHSQQKGRSVSERTGAPEQWMDVFEFTPSRLRDLPLPIHLPLRQGALLVELAQELVDSEPADVLLGGSPSRERLAAARARWSSLRARMIALQEELDWEVYRLYGLTHDEALIAPSDSVPELRVGERAFEVLLARRLHDAGEATAWYERQGSAPIVDLPQDWPSAYRDVVQRRIQAISSRPELSLLERPDFKRRWMKPSWDDLQNAALKNWILDRCEDPKLWFAGDVDSARPRPMTIEELATRIATDPTVVEAAKIYEPNRPLVDVIASCVEEEHAPYLAALRLRESGLAKRADWERVWQLQHADDVAGANHSSAPPTPPNYASADFLKASYWRMRGKLDVPGERFISYPQVPSAGKKNLLLGWAGWNKAQRAQVLAGMISSPSVLETGSVVPLLAGLQEILPWLAWSKGNTPEISAEVADYNRFISQQLQRLKLTVDDLRAWRPPKSRRGRPMKNSKTRPS